MINRKKYISELNELSEFMPVLGITGPRQVGKTTLAQIFSRNINKKFIYLDLEKPSDYNKLAEAELYFFAHTEKCVIIDEIQVRPELFSIIRAVVDEHRVPLRFIILGSASPGLIKDASESLAGRIGYLHLQPFSISELDDIDITKHHFFGGFPDSYLTKTNTQARKWLENYIKMYIERDLPLIGLSASPFLVRRLWEMLAWQNGNLLNATAIGNSIGLTNHTINSYIDYLEGTFMVKRLQPFSYNIRKRIVKAPKVYISDTGILHTLMRVRSFDELTGMPSLGASFETYVLQQILAEKPDDLDVYYYRTHAGTEVDFVITKALNPIAGIEVKYTSAPKLTKGLLLGIEDLGTKQNFIITPGSETYDIKDNIKVCGVEKFITEYLRQL